MAAASATARPGVGMVLGVGVLPGGGAAAGWQREPDDLRHYAAELPA